MTQFNYQYDATLDNVTVGAHEPVSDAVQESWRTVALVVAPFKSNTSVLAFFTCILDGDDNNVAAANKYIECQFLLDSGVVLGPVPVLRSMTSQQLTAGVALSQIIETTQALHTVEVQLRASTSGILVIPKTATLALQKVIA